VSISIKPQQAELNRLKGELLLRTGEKEPEREGEQMALPGECLRQALDVARRQQGKALELRATMS
jgi:hypothetical protein